VKVRISFTYEARYPENPYFAWATFDDDGTNKTQYAAASAISWEDARQKVVVKAEAHIAASTIRVPEPFEMEIPSLRSRLPCHVCGTRQETLASTAMGDLCDTCRSAYERDDLELLHERRGV